MTEEHPETDKSEYGFPPSIGKHEYRKPLADGYFQVTITETYEGYLEAVITEEENSMLSTGQRMHIEKNYFDKIYEKVKQTE